MLTPGDMFPVIHEVGDSSQAVFSPPMAEGAWPDEHYRFTFTNVNLVVCPTHTVAMWGRAALKGCRETPGSEDDQDTAATKYFYFFYLFFDRV